MINVVGDIDVTIRDLTIDGGNNTKHGLNIYGGASVEVEDVTIQNNRWYAAVVNGSSLTANGLITSGNQWGVNVDNKSIASLTVVDAAISEDASIVFDQSDSDGTKPSAEIQGGSFQYVFFNKGAEKTALEISGGTFATDLPEDAVDIFRSMW